MLAVSLYWLLVIELFSLVSFPIAYRAFSRMPDRGWAFSKPMGLLFVGFGTWMIGLTHTIPNSRWTVLIALILVGVMAWAAGRRRIPEMRAFIREHNGVIIAAELLFIAVFLGLTLLRASITSISHTEQPMDFMFLNAAVTSPFYPPNDPWLAGEAVSYYYLGYLMIGAVTLFSGIALPVAYNLGLATVGALAAIAAFGVVYNLVRLSKGSEDGAVFGGVAAAFLLLAASNLAGTLELARAAGAGGDAFWTGIGIDGLTAPAGASSGWVPDGVWWWFRASRVATVTDAGPTAITEFPFFSFLLGDLHPHLMSIGFVLLTVGAALQLYLQPGLLRLQLSGRALLVGAIAVAVGALAVAVELSGTDAVGVRGPATWLLAAAAVAAIAALGSLWPLGLTLVLSAGALAAINLWDLPLGVLLVVSAVLLNAARNERSVQFGAALALSGDVMIAGAPTDPAAASRGGAAYVYERQNERWTRVKRLLPTNPQDEAGFGSSVSADGDLIAVGAPNADGAGVVYLHARDYARDAGRWPQRTALRPPPGQRATAFGRSVAVAEGVLAVGAQDAVYLFVGEGAAWTLQAKLSPRSAGTDFGRALALDAGTLAVGAPAGNGALALYTQQGAGWTLEEHLTPGAQDAPRGFGQSVSIREGQLIVGALGAAIIFHRHPDGWRREAVLSAPEASAKPTFGSSVAVGRRYASVGAQGGQSVGEDGKPAKGCVYIYAYDRTDWSFHARLTDEDTGPDSVYGASVAMSGETVAAGAPGSGQGAAAVYHRALDRWDLQSKVISRWRFGRAALAAGILVSAMLAAFLPFYGTFESSANGVLPLRELSTRPLHLLLIWGVPALLVLPVLALALKHVFTRANWSFMRFGIALFAAFTPLMFWLQPVYAFPMYGVGLALFALHQAGYRMPRTDEMLFAYNPRATLAVGSIVVIGGFAGHGVVNNERGINNELIAIDRLLIVVPMAIVLGLAIYGAWTLAHRDSEALRTARPGTAAPTRSDALAPALMLLAVATALIMGVELFHVSDFFGGDLRRFNTTFKLYYQAWLLMAVLGGFGLWYVGSRWNRRVLAGRLGVAAWSAVLVIVLGAVSYYPLAAATSRADEGHGLDLDGQSHLLRNAPAEHAAIQWIRDNVARDAVVVEAAVTACGNSGGCSDWTDAGRIASSTGRPTVLGWEQHELQWRTSGAVLGARRDDVRTIYETEDRGLARGLLAKYDASYVVVGPRERRAYGTDGTAKFGELGFLVFPGVGAADDVLIYRLGSEDEA